MDVQIRNFQNGDWETVSRIYQQGMDTNLATFETNCPSFDEWDKSHLSYCRFVAVIDNHIAGFAVLSPVSSRCVYGGVAEVSVYIDKAYQGRGLGEKLLNHLISESERQELWTLQAGIMQNNIASIHLHEKCGFRMVGYRENIGRDRNGEWRNTVLMEKRSNNYLFEGDSIMKKLEIFEPAMCCDTGICGVGVDPELIRISTVLNALKLNGITIGRYNLNSAPMAFVNNKTINDFINDSGVEKLPAFLVDDKIEISGRYPTNEEIANYLGVSIDMLTAKETKQNSKSGGCNCAGGCC